MTSPAVDLTEAEDAGQDGARPRAAHEPLGAGRAPAWILVVTGALGLLASFVITVDKFRLLEDPGFQPSCSIDSVLSCTNVMSSPQASVFGFANPLLGLAGYAGVTLMVMGLLEFPWVVPVTWYLVIVMLIATRFWAYWQSLL